MVSAIPIKDVKDRRLAFLSESQKTWLKKAEEFADKISLEDAIKSDTTNVFRRDLFEAACKEGMGALPFPTTYGGSGGDYLSFVVVNEEFARRCVPIMSSLGVHVLCQEPVNRFGSDEQKAKYLPPSASGKYLAAFGLTEPNAGSDTAALAATARISGDEYILNGSKVFITSGASSDYFIVMARLLDSPEGLQNEKSITAFIVEKEFPGFKIGQKFDMLGMRGYSTCELVFDDCRVPKWNLLGKHGEGRKVALSSLAKGRVTIAAQCTGWAQGALEAVLRMVKSESSSKHRERIIGQIGEMAVMVESARVLTYQAAAAIDRGQNDIVLASMAKMHASDCAMKISTDAMTLMGLQSSEPDYLLERIFRDAKAGQIYEGANQIQRMLIARELLK